MAAPQLDPAPGFWMHETSGVLAPVIHAYLRGDELSRYEVGIMRAYLRQWINAPGFVGPEVDALRREVDSIATRNDVTAWLDRAVDAGVDPL